MRIVSLHVENFRAIRRVQLDNIETMIVIAGPNGCGKSCLLDSIRLFKSVYGGYQPNELQHWFGEFQINFQRNPQQMASLLRDKNQPAVIQAGILLSEDEIRFVQSNLRVMLENHVWSTLIPGMNDPWIRARGNLAAELRAHKPTVDKRVEEHMEVVSQQLQPSPLMGYLQILPSGEARTVNNVLLELIFSSFYPKHLGLIDYHGSHRNYGREELGGINLSLDQETDRYRTSSLYNYGNKYTNIKSEMAAEYVRQALAKQAGLPTPGPAVVDLSETLKELFTLFFPGKTFLGPVPTWDGNLTFPVRLSDGSTHDINELSSGEKEVLFGYLRLRNSAPRYSVVLLDEPELHLNPALIRGLPQFYHKKLALELENQIWVVTHSDAFLREAVAATGLRVVHMQHAGEDPTPTNQVHDIRREEQAESIILDLVGDLAAYRPGAKVVIFEGENSEFDLRMVSRLFPDLEKDLNFISGGSRYQVETLHRTLRDSVRAGRIPVSIFSVVDRDSSSGADRSDSGHFTWDVYHIENYLLDEEYVWRALKHASMDRGGLTGPQMVAERLLEIAEKQVGEYVSHQIREEINRELVSDLDLGVEPSADDIAQEMAAAIERSLRRIDGRREDTLNLDAIRNRVEQEQRGLEQSLRNGDWVKVFKGRNILRQFAGRYVPGMRYEYFRDSIISEMASAGFQPEGMKSVLEKIAADPG